MKNKIFLSELIVLFILFTSPTLLLGQDNINEKADFIFVIDDTGSMTDNIKELKEVLLEILEVLPPELTDDEIFQLVTFKDDVTFNPPTDFETIRNQVKSLSVSGGGDCREASLEAAIVAQKNLKDGGWMLHATDAPPQTYNNFNTITEVEDWAKTVPFRFFSFLDRACSDSPAPRLAKGISNGRSYSDNKQLATRSEIRELKKMQKESNARKAVPDDFTAVNVFSTIADQTGGIFVYLPELKDNTTNGAELYGNLMFNVLYGAFLQSIALTQPFSGPAGGTLEIEITGINTNFENNSSITFSDTEISVLETKIISPESMTAIIKIGAESTLGLKDVTVNSGEEEANGRGLFEVKAAETLPIVLSVSPPTASRASSADIKIFGTNTKFSNSSEIYIGEGITVTNVQAESTDVLTANIQINEDAPLGFRSIRVTTGTEIATENDIRGPLRITERSIQINETLDDYTTSDVCDCDNSKNSFVNGDFLFHKVLTVTGTEGQTVQAIAANDTEFRDKSGEPISFPVTLKEFLPGVYQTSFWLKSNVSTTVLTQMNENSITNRYFTSNTCDASGCDILGCGSKPGLMQTSGSFVCESGFVNFSEAFSSLAENCVKAYVIHEGEEFDGSNYLAIQKTGRFESPKEKYNNKKLYVTAVLGLPNEDGFPKLDHNCTVWTPYGSPVIFFDPITVNVVDKKCEDESYYIDITIEGGIGNISPNISYRSVTDGSTKFRYVSKDEKMTFGPYEKNGDYTIEITDAKGCESSWKVPDVCE